MAETTRIPVLRAVRLKPGDSTYGPPGSAVEIDYTNHKGERRTRFITPLKVEWSEGSVWHPDPQWILRAWDLEKQDWRDFAVLGIHSWRPARVVET